MKPLARSIDALIQTIRGQKVLLDADLARLYGVTTKRLNEAIKRNAGRFPKDFLFRLTSSEWRNLKSQFATSSETSHGGRRTPPFAFSEHGALQAANVLKSTHAVAMSVYVIRAFVQMRENIAANAAILKRLAEVDKTLLLHDSALREIYKKLMPLLAPQPPPPPKRRIGFHP